MKCFFVGFAEKVRVLCRYFVWELVFTDHFKMCISVWVHHVHFVFNSSGTWPEPISAECLAFYHGHFSEPHMVIYPSVVCGKEVFVWVFVEICPELGTTEYSRAPPSEPPRGSVLNEDPPPSFMWPTNFHLRKSFSFELILLNTFYLPFFLCIHHLITASTCSFS